MSTHYSVTSTLFYMLGIVVVLTLFSMFITMSGRSQNPADKNQDDQRAKSSQNNIKSDAMNNEKKLERDSDSRDGEDILVGNKRFKLYEKKKLNYEKAKKYCKAREGQLAKALNIEEMRRLQILIMKSKSVSSGLWVQVDKREWKKHSMKMTGRHNLGENFAGEGMTATMMGGGPTEMCPTLSVSTRSLQPENCRYDMPFVCEFPVGQNIPKKGLSEKPSQKNGKTKTKKPNQSSNKGAGNKNKSYDSKKKDQAKKSSNNYNNKKKSANPNKQKILPNNANRRHMESDRLRMGDFRANSRMHGKQKNRDRLELKK